MEEWKKEIIKMTPDDNIEYIIFDDVISFTTQILREYGNYTPPAEGLVYWGGTIENNQVLVTTCIAPKIKASRYNIGIDHYSNYKVVETLQMNKIIHIGQVHSHPGRWVGHSETDDECAAFKVQGLLSIVVPDFALHGMNALKYCGVHRFNEGQFMRLSEKYINNHFKIIKNNKSNLIDLRNE